MYGITDLRKDTLIDIDGVPYRVTDYSHTQMGRGGATVRVKVKNLLNGSMLEKVYKNDEKIEPASIEKVTLQYLYQNGNKAVFMDMTTFDQQEINREMATDVIKFIPEGGEVSAMLYKDQVIGFDLPKNTPIKVSSAPGGAKGDTATGATKAVELETGIEIQVPLFIKTGDMVKVDTRTGQYLERMK